MVAQVTQDTRASALCIVLCIPPGSRTHRTAGRAAVFVRSQKSDALDVNRVLSFGSHGLWEERARRLAEGWQQESEAGPGRRDQGRRGGRGLLGLLGLRGRGGGGRRGRGVRRAPLPAEHHRRGGFASSHDHSQVQNPWRAARGEVEGQGRNRRAHRRLARRPQGPRLAPNLSHAAALRRGRAARAVLGWRAAEADPRPGAHRRGLPPPPLLVGADRLHGHELAQRVRRGQRLPHCGIEREQKRRRKRGWWEGGIADLPGWHAAPADLPAPKRVSHTASARCLASPTLITECERVRAEAQEAGRRFKPIDSPE
mmetsp:Transcript_44222/g.143480  ORF Transcript_44222/g.143480 Transcript_44222/m.143480 type:complete len:313 (-) Transcript_44222:117-1055(-)